MFKRLIHRYPLLRVKGLHDKALTPLRPQKGRETHQSLCQKINSLLGRMREQALPGAAFPDRQRADVVPRSPGRDGVKLVQARGADDVQDEVELVAVVPSGEEGSPR